MAAPSTMDAAAMSLRKPVNQLSETASPSTSAEPVLAPMSPPSPDMGAVAVPWVAVSRIICLSWVTVPCGSPLAVAGSRPSRSKGTR